MKGMKKQTIGRLFSLLMCATLAFTSVDLGVFAATDSENTEIVTEVSNDEEAEVTEDSDTVVVSDEDTVVTTTEDSDDIVIVDDDNITDNGESDDDIIIEDDDVSLVAIPGDGKGPTTADTVEYKLVTGETNSNYACAYDTTKVGSDTIYILTEVRYEYGAGPNHAFGYNSNEITSDDYNALKSYYRDVYLGEKWGILQKGCFSGNYNYIIYLSNGKPRYTNKDKELSEAKTKLMASKFKYLLRAFVTEANSRLTKIEEGVFCDTKGLQYVDLHTATELTTIEAKAFSGSSVKHIILPDNITTIGTDAIPSNTAIYCHDGSTTFNTLLKNGYSNIYIGDVFDFTQPSTKGGTPSVTGSGSPALARKTFALTTSVKSTDGRTTGSTISPSSGAYYPQDSISFTVTPATGYTTQSLVVNNTNCTSGLTYKPVRSNVTATLTVTPKNYAITLNANGGTCSQSTYTATYNKVMSDLPTPARKGYIFTSWNTAANGSGVSYTNTSVYQKDEAITLYAQWKSDEKEYSVDLDSVGGSCDVTSVKIITTQPCPTLPTPTKSGYSFMGWYTEKDGKGIQVKAGDNIVDIFDVLYAYYVDGSNPTPTPSPDDPTPTPTPGPDDPTPTPTPGPVVEGFNIKYVYPANAEIKKTLPTNYENKTIKLPKASMKGYTFIGWFVNDVKVTTISEYVSVCRGNITAEARFAVKDGTNKFATPYSTPCTITYDYNGGISKVDMPTTYANRKTVKIPTPVREGYKFLGWYYTNAKNELVKVSKLGYKMGVCEGGKNIKLKAMWTPKQYKIKLNGGGGKKLGKAPTITTFYNVDTYLPNANYIFKKGDLTATCWTVNGTEYKFNTPYKNLGKAKGTVKVKAKWILTIKGSNYDVSKLNEVSENSLD